MNTSKKQIVEWCQSNICELGYGVDASEMNTHCFRCGCERPTEKCHVIPASLGGKDEPSNYRMLCHDCHLEGPNVNDPNAMDEWIRATNVGSYNIFWKLRNIYTSTIDDAIIHWGEKTLNNSTQKWLASKIEKTYREEFPYVTSDQIQKCLVDLKL